MECESKAKEDMKKQLEDQCGVCCEVISLVAYGPFKVVDVPTILGSNVSKREKDGRR